VPAPTEILSKQLTLHRHKNATTPIINAFAHITDRNGVDISSSFKVKVFHKTPNTQTSNVTGGSKLHGRQAFEVVRMVDQCHGDDETFIESHCTPDDEEEGSLSSFAYTCRRTVAHFRGITGEYLGRRPAYRTRKGQCDSSELCVDGFGSRTIASCVHAGLFDDFTLDKNGRIKGMVNGEVFDVSKAHAALTGSDQFTPLETKAMDIGAWINSASLAKDSVQTKKCRNCVELGTDMLQPAPDSLKVEATLLTAGAVAGVLWLVLSSG